IAKRIPVSWWAFLTDGVREPMKETWRQGAVKQSNSLTDSGCSDIGGVVLVLRPARAPVHGPRARPARSEEHTSELQSLMRLSYAVFCLKKKKKTTRQNA